MKQVSFKRTATEDRAISDCVKRLCVLGYIRNKDEALHHHMNLSACNANGCPLDFKRLKAFDDFSFLHDMMGINRFLDRKTGGLTNCFLPRCAKPERKVRTSEAA